MSYTKQLLLGSAAMLGMGMHAQQASKPNSMASEGMRFTQAYAGSPVSAPSRATLMTGQHTGHTHVRGNKEYWKGRPAVKYGVAQEPDRVGQEPYDTAHVILPEIMKANGYTTGMFGKWAGGYEGSVSTPKTRGIDEYYGYICQYMAHRYFPNFLNRYSPRRGDTDVVRITMDQNVQYSDGCTNPDYAKRKQYSGDMIHQEALEWIDRPTSLSMVCLPTHCHTPSYTSPTTRYCKPTTASSATTRPLLVSTATMPPSTHTPSLRP